jgi:hypothetical protein
MVAPNSKMNARLAVTAAFFAFSLGFHQLSAHSLPNSKALLIVDQTSVLLRFHTPYEILALAYKGKVDLSSATCSDSLRHYFLKHISISDSLNSHWAITIGEIRSVEATDLAIGKYQEVQADITLKPTDSRSLLNFTLTSDLVIHQIPNQSILVFAKTGIRKDAATQLGVISIDIPTGKIFPLKVTLKNHSGWSDFKEMFYLGARHIKEGTDHLLFILTLLLPACLIVQNKRWTKFGGTKWSAVKLAKILTAFTVGHSITLLVGGFGWFKIPTQLVEVAIAFSILLTAIHAVRPLFYNKEVFIALGFGFLHGLAFSQALQEFELTYFHLLTSVLAFNLGIEAMQLFIMALALPWLVLLSKSLGFNYLKNIVAAFIAVLAIGWIAQRINGNDNFISLFTDTWIVFSPMLFIWIAALSITWFAVAKYVSQSVKSV